MYGKPTGGVLDFQLTNLSKLYHLNNASNMKSLHLAMRIFELLQKVARMSESNRMILETACRLQDIGITVDFYNHQKYALYLIENSTIFGLDSRQKFIAALTVAQVGNRFFFSKRTSEPEPFGYPDGKEAGADDQYCECSCYGG